MQIDRWIALGLFVLSGWYGFTARQFTETAMGDPLGPSAFPVTLSILLAISSAWLFIRPGEDQPAFNTTIVVRTAGVLISLIAFALLLEFLGFVITTTLTMIALATIFDGPRKASIAAAVLFSLVAYALFGLALDLRLPAGQFFSFG